MDGVEVSVINQVLNQLEQRGATTVLEQTMVRAVPHTKRKFALPLLIIGLVLIIGMVAWQRMQVRRPGITAVSISPKAPQGVSHAEGVINSPGSSELEKLTLQHQPVVAASVPVSAVPVVATAVASAGNASLAEALLPASRQSFELSSVPLPSAEDRPVNAAPPARPAKRQPVQTAPPNTRAVVETSSGVLPMKQVSPAQQAEAEFHKAVALMQQGHITDAIAGYEAVLRMDASHDAARQALVALLLEGKRGADAGRVLQDGLKVKPGHTGFAMLLARLQVEHGAVDLAAATLEKSLPYADQQADYQAFFAALLQRQNRHREAITHYQIALQLAPNNGVWLMGYGISLQAAQRNDDAKDAFRRALESQTLSPELQAFVQQKLKSL